MIDLIGGDTYMSKKYNLGKKSDMRRFQRDFEKSANKIFSDAVSKMSVDIQCPKCGTNFKARNGNQMCPNCSSNIGLKISN